jgi:hypothetical protein
LPQRDVAEIISVPGRGGNSGWKSTSMRKAIAILI